jgi:hypothetical protein
MEAPYGVAIVVDPDFGSRLNALAARLPVWIAATHANRMAAEQSWRENSIESSTDGVTTFVVDPSDSPEEWLIGILRSVDLHHGEQSRTQPYSVIEVFGTRLTPHLRATFGELGLEYFEETAEGFRSSRAQV